MTVQPDRKRAEPRLEFVVERAYVDWLVPAMAFASNGWYLLGGVVAVVGAALRIMLARKVVVRTCDNGLCWSEMRFWQREGKDETLVEAAVLYHWNAVFSRGVQVVGRRARIAAATRGGSRLMPPAGMQGQLVSPPRFEVHIGAALLNLPNVVVLGLSLALLRTGTWWLTLPVVVGALGGIPASIAAALRNAPSIVLAGEESESLAE